MFVTASSGDNVRLQTLDTRMNEGTCVAQAARGA